MAASVAVHAAIMAAFLWSASGNSFAGGAGAQGGDGDAVMVSLVGPLGGSREHADSNAEQARLAALLQKVRDPTPESLDAPKPAQHASLEQLFNDLRDARTASRARQADRPGQGEGGSQAQSAQAMGAQHASAVQGSADERGDTGHMSGDMWSQLQTCWKPQAPVPVTLEVVIDSSGRLALPPRILRPDSATLDERRLRAEAQAIQAVAQCAPFHAGAPLWGRRTYQFAFAPK